MEKLDVYMVLVRLSKLGKGYLAVTFFYRICIYQQLFKFCFWYLAF